MSKKRARGGNPHRHTHRPEGFAGVRPDKRLGQNFLIDEEVIGTIIEESGVNEKTLVLEIGPGTGALTLPMAEMAGRVIAVDLDPAMIEGLRIKTFGMDNVELILGDILETDIKGMAEKGLKEHGLEEFRIVGASIAEAVFKSDDPTALAAIKARIQKIIDAHPLYPELEY